MTSNRMPGLDFGLGEAADTGPRGGRKLRAGRDRAAQTMTLVKNAGWRGAGPWIAPLLSRSFGCGAGPNVSLQSGKGISKWLSTVV